jgi:hypothetical protein
MRLVPRWPAGVGFPPVPLRVIVLVVVILSVVVLEGSGYDLAAATSIVAAVVMLSEVVWRPAWPQRSPSP